MLSNNKINHSVPDIKQKQTLNIYTRKVTFVCLHMAISFSREVTWVIEGDIDFHGRAGVGLIEI